MRIRLETRDGRTVASGEMIPCVIPFEVLAWGSRLFVLHETPTDPALPLIYREGCLFVLQEGVTWTQTPDRQNSYGDDVP